MESNWNLIILLGEFVYLRHTKLENIEYIIKIDILRGFTEDILDNMFLHVITDLDHMRLQKIIYR